MSDNSTIITTWLRRAPSGYVHALRGHHTLCGIPKIYGRWTAIFPPLAKRCYICVDASGSATGETP